MREGMLYTDPYSSEGDSGQQVVPGWGVRLSSQGNCSSTHLSAPLYYDDCTASTMKYEIILYWSNEDKVFVAEVPELPGCMAHGKTPQKALTNVHQAIELWIDTAKEFGDSIPEPKGRRLMLA